MISETRKKNPVNNIAPQNTLFASRFSLSVSSVINVSSFLFGKNTNMHTAVAAKGKIISKADSV